MSQAIVEFIPLQCTQTAAFTVFLKKFATWSPTRSFSLAAEQGHRPRKILFTPKGGGKITETLFDGSQADCGKVLEFSPVRKLAIAWRISITERKATREDVAFRENGDRGVVRLTHSD